MRRRIANITSNTLSPFVISLVVILLLSLEATRSTLEALKWSLLLIGISILPVYLVVIYLVRRRKLGNHFIAVRQQRTKIYLLAGIGALAGGAVLFYLGAPPVLFATVVTGLLATVVFMGINLWWKISLHAAFMAASVTTLVMVYGSIAALAVVLLPLVAWARIELEEHSIAQVVVGTLLAASIAVVVFYLFGLL